MSQDTDGVNDVMDGGARVALTLAGRVGERLAREREQAARDALALADAEAREVKARLAAERAAARAQLAPVQKDAWWETATTKQITDALQVAVAWLGVDPQAAAAAAVIQGQVQQRGVPVDQLATQSGRLGALGTGASQGAARPEGAAEKTEAGRVLADIGQDGVRGEADDVLSYDSPARREERAARLAEQGRDPESIAAVMSADVSQAGPGRDAVRVEPIKSVAVPATQRVESLELDR